MKVARSVAEVLSEHTTLTLECIDRMYLNVYVPMLQRAAGAAYFFRKMRGAAVPSSALMAPMTQRFVDAIKSFPVRNGIEIVSFRRRERKDDRTRQYLRNWTGGEGVLYIGKAQEKARVVRTERRHDPATGDSYPWLVTSTAMVNQFYVYAVDDDFGPFFLKFCSYFPYNAKLCINGHEYLKRQLTKRGIAYESLDNGILHCADPKRMQRLADGLTAGKVDALLRKWLARLPHPFAARDRQQGIRYDVSILQALAGNQLSGPIPPELGQLTGLRYLSIDGDTGLCIPAQIQDTVFGRLAINQNGVPLCGAVPTLPVLAAWGLALALLLIGLHLMSGNAVRPAVVVTE